MHGGDIYNNRVVLDHSVNLNPYFDTGDGADPARLYPDTDQSELRKIIASSENVEPENVFSGCGASELLMAAAYAFKPKCALFIEPCFTGYRHVVGALGDCVIKRYYLRDEDGFALTEGFAGALSSDVDMIFIADPNNPTGRNIDNALLIKIFDRARELGITVLLDESFYPLSRGYDSRRSAGFIREYENLVIIRSYTKTFALPGIRMGCVVSSSENIEKIRAHLPEWNLPAHTEEVMKECVGKWNKEIYEGSMRLIETERVFLSDELSRLGFTVYPSDTAFILFKGPEGLYEKLLEQGVLIRNCDDYDGLGSGYYRIAVRRHDENVRLAGAIRSIVPGGVETGFER